MSSLGGPKAAENGPTSLVNLPFLLEKHGWKRVDGHTIDKGKRGIGNGSKFMFGSAPRMTSHSTTLPLSARP